MKTEFQFDLRNKRGLGTATAKIVDYRQKRSYIYIDVRNQFNKGVLNMELRGKSLETFAVNILKSLKSSRLKR